LLFAAGTGFLATTFLLGARARLSWSWRLHPPPVEPARD
jgi:hypothetical protein